MALEIIIRYSHFIGIFCLFASLVVEHLLIESTMTTKEIRRLRTIDLIYGASAAVVLVTGLLLWFAVGKPTEFYSQNAVFHTKITIFLLTAGLSVIPTLFFLKHGKANPEAEVILPKSIIMIIRFELLLLTLIPLLAVIMSRGIGSFGQ